MDLPTLQKLLEAYKGGTLSAEDIAARLNTSLLDGMKEATIDNWRGLRTGFPEVIFGLGKSVEQVVSIAQRMLGHQRTILVTRAPAGLAQAFSALTVPFHFNEKARTLTVGKPEPGPGTVAIVTAGTGDLPVAEEAAETVEAMAVKSERFVDVGVAGLHRTLEKLPRLRAVDAIVVVAGMEGALPSVVSGLVDVPVLAVPTSIGYGAHLGGLAPLFAMLNSCAAGVSVVNIDNGFGAGFQAALIAKKAART